MVLFLSWHVAGEPEALWAELRECVLSEACSLARPARGQWGSSQAHPSAQGVQRAAVHVSVRQCYVHQDSGLNISQLSKWSRVTSSLSFVQTSPDGGTRPIATSWA